MAVNTIERPILSEDVVSFTDCRGRLAEYFDKTRTTHRPVVVTQNGRATTVIVNLADWEQVYQTWEDANSITSKLRDASRFARMNPRRLSHEEVFGGLKEITDAGRKVCA